MLLVILNICSKEELADDELLSGPKSPGNNLDEIIIALNKINVLVLQWIVK